MSADVPAPEGRVRAYIEAQAEEDARTGIATDEIAWAVPEGGPLVALAVADIRDVLAELEAARSALEWIAARAATASEEPTVRGLRYRLRGIHTTATEGTER